MKQVTGYGPNRQFPFIPKYIGTSVGIFNVKGLPCDGDVIPCNQLNIDDNEWIGVNNEGNIESFRRSEEHAWKIQMADRTVKQASDPNLDPELRIKILSAAALLVNLSTPDLLEELNSKRIGNESLVNTFLRTLKKQ